MNTLFIDRYKNYRFPVESIYIPHVIITATLKGYRSRQAGTPAWCGTSPVSSSQ
jgi:hypothetical protein